MTLLLACAMSLSGPLPHGPLPSAAQLAWHDLETYAFVHFGPNTFTGQEWGSGQEPADVFNPKRLDCRQWVRAFKRAGMRAVIVTAKHHDGFCLWPTPDSSHTVAHSPFKRDVLKELSDACRAEGLQFGVYLSPWDRNHPTYGTDAYNAVFQRMLQEALTKYGPVFEVWFDGANGEGPNGKRQVYDWPAFVQTVRTHAPNAVIFSDAGPDVRWVGNEAGFAAETNWNTVDRSRYVPGTPLYKELTEGAEGTPDWVPNECDVSIRPGWFWRATEDERVKSLGHLVRIWLGSVGRGSNLLLNVPPNSDGLVSEPDARRLAEWRDWLDSAFAEDLSRSAVALSDGEWAGGQFGPSRTVDGDPRSFWAAPAGARTGTVELRWPRDATIDTVWIEEPIAMGQRVRSFVVEGLRGRDWSQLAQGTTVGRRRIVQFPEATVRAVRVRVADSRAEPLLSRLSAYRTGPLPPE
jgi:alpha-L-fucosidase